MPNTIRQVLKYKEFLEDVKSGKIQLTDSEEDKEKWWKAAKTVYGFG